MNDPMTILLSAAVEPVTRRGHARAEGSASDEAAASADQTGSARACSEAEVN
jgi:hypothetical protein